MAQEAVDRTQAAQPGGLAVAAARLLTAPEPCLLVDAADRIRFANDAALTVLRLPLDQLQGRIWWQSGLPAATAGELARGCAEVRAGRRTVHRTVPLPTPAGPMRRVCVLAQIDGAPGFVLVRLDASAELSKVERHGPPIGEERLDLILGNVSEAITAVFVDTGTTVRNPAWLRFHGLESFAELPGWELEEVAALFEVYDEAGRRLAVDEVPMSRALRGETFQDVEVRLRRVDTGRTWWGSYNGGALRDADGRVTAALISMRDTTERRRAAEALRASEQRYRAAVTHAAVPVMLHAEDGEVLAVSDGLVAATGYGRAELCRFENWLELAYRERAADIAERVALRFKIGLGIPAIELTVHTRYGQRRWIWTAPAPELLSDGRRCFFAIGSDVTERNAAEAALRLSEERYRLAAAAIDGLVYDWDLASDRVDRSPQAARLLGLPAAEMGPTSGWWSDRVHPEDLARLAPQARELLTGRRQNFLSEYRIRHADGHWLHVVDHAFVVRGAGGEPVRVVGVTMDVSARRRAEAELRAMVDQRDALLGELHHRVKNNLQLIASVLHLQAARTDDPDQRRFAASAVARIAAIGAAHDILHRGGSTDRIDLGGYLRDLASQLGQSFLERGARIEVDLPATAPPVDLDRAVPLGLIVNELVTNAFKHGQLGDRAPSVALGLARQPDGRWRLSVTVEGKVPEVDSAPLRGFGLQLVELFTRQLGGTMRVQRTPVYVTDLDLPAWPLPGADQPPQAQADGPQPPSQAGDRSG